MKPFLVYDLETIFDTDLYRKIDGIIDPISDKELTQIYMDENNNKFPPIHFHKIVSMSRIICSTDGNMEISARTTTSPKFSEEEIVSSLIRDIHYNSPILVTWNGINFDLPLVQYKMMQYSIIGPTLMDQGEINKDSKWNSYRSRYHSRHIDLADQMTNHGQKVSSLDAMSKLIGLPGKAGVGGKEVFNAWYDRKYEEIGDYNTIDTLLTALIYIRYCLISGQIDVGEYRCCVLLAINSVKESFKSSLIDNYVEELLKSNYTMKVFHDIEGV